MNEQRSVVTETTPLSSGPTSSYTAPDEAETVDGATSSENSDQQSEGADAVDPESFDRCFRATRGLIKLILILTFGIVLYKYNKLLDSCDQNALLDSKSRIASLQSQLSDVLTTSDRESFKRLLKESRSRLNSLNIPSGRYVRFNAASYMDGARVVGRQSILSSRYSREQTGYVLFERDELPLDRAWCSNERNPVLTIQLSRNTTPLAVSYQHTKEYDQEPIGAPLDYGVYACLDSECNDSLALVTDCTYTPSAREKGKEQICNITQNLFDTEVNRIQFRFEGNHGNVDKTCVYLIRVYGEKKLSRPEFNPRNVELCTDIARDYYHSSFSYLMRNKSCSLLYSNQCCKDCPECCRTCEIEDFNSSFLSGLIVGIFFTTLPLTIFIFGPCGFIVYQVYSTKKTETEENPEDEVEEPYQDIEGGVDGET